MAHSGRLTPGRLLWAGLPAPFTLAFVFDMMRSELKVGVSILEPILAWVGLIGAVCLGAYWTGQAVVTGNQLGVIVRFAASVVCGLYYLALLERSRR